MFHPLLVPSQPESFCQILQLSVSFPFSLQCLRWLPSQCLFKDHPLGERRLSFWSIRFSWRWSSQNHMKTFLISALDIKFGLVRTDSHYKGLVINPFHVGQKNFAWESPNGASLGVGLFQVQWGRRKRSKGSHIRRLGSVLSRFRRRLQKGQSSWPQ